MDCSTHSLVFGLVHLGHAAAYAMLLTWAAPPDYSSVWTVDALLMLCGYTAACATGFRWDRNVYIGALFMLFSAAIGAEAMEVYNETQRSMTLLRVMLHTIFSVFWLSANSNKSAT